MYIYIIKTRNFISTFVIVFDNLGTSLVRNGQNSENAGARNKDEHTLANESGM